MRICAGMATTRLPNPAKPTACVLNPKPCSKEVNAGRTGQSCNSVLRKQNQTRDTIIIHYHPLSSLTMSSHDDGALQARSLLHTRLVHMHCQVGKHQPST